MVILDAIVFLLQRYGGVSTYYRELIPRVLAARPDATARLYGDTEHVTAGRQIVQFQPRTLERYRDLTGVPTGSIVHSSYYRLGSGRSRNVVTVYDFMYERFTRGLDRLVHSAQKGRALGRADALICISHATRSDLFEYHPRVPSQRVHVVHLAAGKEFFPLKDAPPAERSPYVLFVGHRAQYKNFAVAVEAVSMVDGLELVCVGGGGFTPAEQGMLERKLAGRYRHAGAISGARLNELYNGAHCLLYPSLFEGFGIPLLEAMAAGCPAIALRRSSMAEIGGDAAILLDDGSSESIAHAIRALFDATERSERMTLGLEHARKFSWERMARETLAIYETLT